MLRRQPFVPVRIHMSDGTTYDIRHPDMAIVTRSFIEVGVEGEEGSGIADEVMYCSLMHIVRIENLNGHRTTA